MSSAAGAPYNFSWVERGRLAALSRPSHVQDVLYLRSVGVSHLVTLSADHPPHPDAGRHMACTILHVPEFEPPSLHQMDQFVAICAEATHKNQAVAVHCRMGRGRTGVMAACYLLAFHHLTPQEAITRIRQMRPYSVETYDQERAVWNYYDLLCQRRW